MTKEKQSALATVPAENTGLDLGTMYQSMVELAKDPDVDPAKMEAMLAMQERMIDRQNLNAYRRAMHEARKIMPYITKEGAIKNKNGEVQSRYAHYEAIDKIVRPLVEPLGLTYGFDYKEGDGGRLLVTCIVSHVDGHEERFGPMPLAIDTTGAKNATQGAGSAGSYGQRYTLCAAFNIVTKGADDDGNMGRPQSDSVAGAFKGLTEDGQRAAAGGSDEYHQWFKSLTNMQRGWLVDNGQHASLKKAAAAHDE